jgi:hypothetical protein
VYWYHIIWFSIPGSWKLGSQGQKNFGQKICFSGENLPKWKEFCLILFDERKMRWLKLFSNKWKWNLQLNGFKKNIVLKSNQSSIIKCLRSVVEKKKYSKISHFGIKKICSKHFSEFFFYATSIPVLVPVTRRKHCSGFENPII